MALMTMFEKLCYNDVFSLDKLNVNAATRVGCQSILFLFYKQRGTNSLCLQ